MASAARAQPNLAFVASKSGPAVTKAAVPLIRKPVPGPFSPCTLLLPKVIVAVQPTRGLDVGAVEAIQRHLLVQRQAGTAILLISEELDELMALSDRIAVIYGGKLMGIVEPHEFDISELGMMMTGTPRSTIQSEPAISVNA